MNLKRAPSKRSTLRCSALALVVVLIACDANGSSPRMSNSSPASTAAGSPIRYEGTWELVRGMSPRGDIPILKRFPIRIDLKGRSANGKATCNGYGGHIRVSGAAFELRGLSADQVGCADALGRAETRYFLTLLRVDFIAVEDRKLRLTGPDVRLVFRRFDRIEIGKIVDRTWLLVTVGRGKRRSKQDLAGRATLRLKSDRTFRIVADCEVLTGEWAQRVASIVFPLERSSRKRPCDESDSRATLVLAITDGGFAAIIPNDRLKISSRGRFAIFRPRR